MFVIACKYDNSHKFIYSLVDDIRKYHKDEEILIVDSDSDDKSYFELKDMYNNVIIDDVKNKNYHIGGYWYAYNNYVRDFYYFLHDSVKIKDNLDYLKEKDLTVLGHFKFDSRGNFGQKEILENTTYELVETGIAIYGPIFFCKRNVMDKLFNKGFNKILPTYNSYPPIQNGELPAYALEGAIGLAFNQEGYDIEENSLLGDVIENGITWLNPNYDGDKQFPVEKFIQLHNRRI